MSLLSRVMGKRREASPPKITLEPKIIIESLQESNPLPIQKQEVTTSSKSPYNPLPSTSPNHIRLPNHAQDLLNDRFILSSIQQGIGIARELSLATGLSSDATASALERLQGKDFYAHPLIKWDGMGYQALSDAPYWEIYASHLLELFPNANQMMIYIPPSDMWELREISQAYIIVAFRKMLNFRLLEGKRPIYTCVFKAQGIRL